MAITLHMHCILPLTLTCSEDINHSGRTRKARVFCFERACIGGSKNRHLYRLKTYKNIGTLQDFYAMGQEKLLMLIMSKTFPKSRCFSIRISSLTQNDLNKEDRSDSSATLILHIRICTTLLTLW